MGLSFVLPVALTPSASGGRVQGAKDVLTRVEVLLATFLAAFKQADVDMFFVVCPSNDIQMLRALFARYTNDSKFLFVSEEDFCPGLFHFMSHCNGRRNRVGWYVQQTIKLAAANHVKSSHYVTLDDDIVCLKVFTERDLINGGRAKTNVETLEDYTNIYTPSFSQAELRIKQLRYLRSAELLQYKRPNRLATHFYGETPVVLDTLQVRALQAHLERVWSTSWTSTLAKKLSWTEYALYYQYLEMTGAIGHTCSLEDADYVLRLSSSVWHNTDCYRNARAYDDEYLNSLTHPDCDGFFLAVQSWLEPARWLPPYLTSTAAFYDVLLRQLGVRLKSEIRTQP